MNKPNWQKNFRKTPDSLLKKIAQLCGDRIMVAAVRKIPASDLRRGMYEHLQMAMGSEGPVFPDTMMPHPMTGKFSLWNAQGREIVRKDLPMVIRTFSAEVPNFGDWSNGSHEICWDREVYQRDFIPPAEAELSITLLRTDVGDDPMYVFRFRLETVLDKSASDFDGHLFTMANLLQENVGAVDVFPSEADQAEYLKTISVHWEILPPGERTEILNRVLSKFRNLDEDLKRKLVERYALLEKLNPVAYISGTSGFQRYFGAQFRDDLVVFENLEYGNAIYVMFDNWETLSQLSRMDLLRNRHSGFERIVHRAGWEQVLRDFIKGRLAA